MTTLIYWVTFQLLHNRFSAPAMSRCNDYYLDYGQYRFHNVPCIYVFPHLRVVQLYVVYLLDDHGYPRLYNVYAVALATDEGMLTDESSPLLTDTKIELKIRCLSQSTRIQDESGSTQTRLKSMLYSSVLFPASRQNSCRKSRHSSIYAVTMDKRMPSGNFVPYKRKNGFRY